MRILCLICLMYGCFGELSCQAQLNDEVLRTQEEFFRSLPTSELNEVIARLNGELAQPLPTLDWATLQRIAAAGLSFDLQAAAEQVMQAAWREVAANVQLLGRLLCLTALCAVLRNLELSCQSGVAKLAHSLCFAVMLLLAVRIFYQGAQLARETIDGMVSFMNALLPIFITLLTLSGNALSSALLSPLMIAAVNSISFIAGRLVVPLLLLSLVLECANYFIKPYRLTGLAGLLKQSCIIIVGFLMMLFIGIMAIQGTAGGISDGLTLRTAKFAASAFVPVVGKLLSDTVEVLFSASLLLRSSIGIFGVLAVGLLCFWPCLKLFIIGLLVKLGGACVEPLGDSQMAACLNSIGSNLYLLAAVMLIIAIMFFLMLVMLIFTGSMTAAVK